MRVCKGRGREKNIPLKAPRMAILSLTRNISRGGPGVGFGCWKCPARAGLCPREEMGLPCYRKCSLLVGGGELPWGARDRGPRRADRPRGRLESEGAAGRRGSGRGELGPRRTAWARVESGVRGRSTAPSGWRRREDSNPWCLTARWFSKPLHSAALPRLPCGPDRIAAPRPIPKAWGGGGGPHVAAEPTQPEQAGEAAGRGARRRGS